MTTDSFTLTGVVTDPSGSQDQVTVTVVRAPLVNHPPVMAAPSVSPAQPTDGYPAGTVVTVHFSASDADNDPLVYTATASDGTVLTPVAGTPGTWSFVA